MTCLSNNDIAKVGATVKDTLELARFLTSNLKLSKLSKALDVRTFVEDAAYSFIFASIFFRDIDDSTLILRRKKMPKFQRRGKFVHPVETIAGRACAMQRRCENHQPVENGEQLGSSGLGSFSWPKNESSKSGLRDSGRGFGVLLQTSDKLSRKSLAICVLANTRLDT